MYVHCYHINRAVRYGMYVIKWMLLGVCSQWKKLLQYAVLLTNHFTTQINYGVHAC